MGFCLADSLKFFLAAEGSTSIKSVSRYVIIIRQRINTSDFIRQIKAGLELNTAFFRVAIYI